MFNNDERDKKWNIFMIAIVFATMTGMIIMDFMSKWRSARHYKEKYGGQNNRKKHDLDFFLIFRKL